MEGKVSSYNFPTIPNFVPVLFSHLQCFNAIKQAPKIYFENLDGLRFFAFLGVFLHHSFHTDLEWIKESSMYQFADFLFKNGDMGVNFFFVLSGFLITYLLINEKERYQKINVGYFYIRRILRIWPLYYAAVLIGFVGFPLLKQLAGVAANETANPILYAFFLGNFSDMWNGLPDATILGVLWSVSIEEQFYLFWPLILSVFHSKHYLKIFVGIIVASVVFRSFYYDDYMVLYYHTFSVISDMCMGGMIAYWSFYRPDFRAFFERLPRWRIAAVYVIGGMAIVFEKSIFTLPFLQVLSRLVYSFFFAFVLLEQNYSRHSFYKMKNWRRLTRWGQMTYGLYCLHFIGILMALMISKRLGWNDSIFGVLVVETVLAFGVSWVIAWLSYRFFERPFLRLKERFAFFKT